ncbi:MAG: YbaB/EbfC family nucleoid-associated protein [Dehalococcoidales bacterium]|nr:YbaB/EbfC family nucleoid-associated protein [Dehalococcoidales bacterium]
MNLSQINQARQLKARLNKAQQELSQTIIEGSSGKGDVKVVMDGQQRVQSIAISPGVIDPANPGQLEKLVLTAVSDAITKSQKVSINKLKGITGGFNLPGL